YKSIYKISCNKMGYTIKNKTSTYINFDDDKPCIMDLLKRFPDGCTVTGPWLSIEYFNTMPCKVVDLYEVGKRIVYNFIDDELESCFSYNSMVNYDILNYKGGNLHGSQLINLFGKKYVVHMNHGRIMSMYVFTGQMLQWGTQ